MEPQHKRCAKCGTVKHFDEFGNFARATDGKRWECKACRHLHYEANKEAFLADNAQRKAQWTPEQHERKRLLDAQNYQANREQRLLDSKKYRANHIEEYRIGHAAYYLANLTERKAANAQWRKDHPQERKASEDRRRARKANAPINDLTDAQWQEIQAHYQYRCVYCPDKCWRCARKKHALTRDHIIPLSKGGSHTFSNIVPACLKHNSAKHDRAPLVPVQPLLFTMAPSKPLQRRTQRD